VRSLRPDLRFVDLRGTIGERLQKLQDKEADGVVLAEAALIRLQLTHLNRIYLPGETAPLQGRLAILTRSDNVSLIKLFSDLYAHPVSRP
jgi:porphobilinogen deaminase